MRLLLIPVFALAAAVPGLSAAQDTPENCWQSAVSTILLNDNDNHTEYATCRAACEGDTNCVAWNFRPHSFDASSPGHCQLLGDVYRSEASDRAFCGRVER